MRTEGEGSGTTPSQDSAVEPRHTDLPAQQRSTTRKRIANILKVVVSLAGILAIVLTQDFQSVSQLIVDVDWRPFLGALLLLVSGSVVRAYRWGCLLWALGVEVSLWRLIRLYFVGAFFNLFLPTGMGGDAVKVYEVSSREGNTAAVIASVLVERFLGIFVLFAIALVALLGSYELVASELRLIIGLLFAGLIICLGLLLQRTWIEALGRRLGLDRLLRRFKILDDLYSSIHLFGRAALLRAVAASLLWNAILIVGYYMLGRAVGITAHLSVYALLVPVVSALLIVPSVGGLGVREGSTILLFGQVGASEAQALALALGFDVSLLAAGLIGAALYILQGFRETRQ